jgi:hypothetical protein
MPLVTLEIINMRAAPWGLFSETVPPQRIVWLTPTSPKAQVDTMYLTGTDVERIRKAVRFGILKEEGLNLEEEVPAEMSVQQRIVGFNALAEEARRSADPPSVQYSEIHDILSGHHNTVKKRLRELATSGGVLRFFLACKQVELEREGGFRGSVIDLLDEIIKIKTYEATGDSGVDHVTGQSLLTDAYFALIEEGDDEDEEEEEAPGLQDLLETS